MTSPTLTAVREAGVLAVVRAPSASGAVRAVDALVAGGVTGIEITYSTPEVPRVLAALRARYGEEIVLGAGTLLEPSQAAEAVDAGARFLVSPGLDDEVVEVMRALRLGVDVVKIFPGALVGPAYLRSLRGPFPTVPFMPTGGVSADNVGEWLASGAVAVGAGGELASNADIAVGRWDVIQANAMRFSAALLAARAPLAA
jgi:2-dehydro-3-deoxyphosphogluconate aldolase/(4S)-4-hydroxy-2-oxoglutarate aldolase